MKSETQSQRFWASLYELGPDKIFTPYKTDKKLVSLADLSYNSFDLMLIIVSSNDFDRPR